MISMITTMTPFLVTTIPTRTNTVQGVLERWLPIEMASVEWEQRMELRLEVGSLHTCVANVKLGVLNSFMHWTVLLYIV